MHWQCMFALYVYTKISLAWASMQCLTNTACHAWPSTYNLPAIHGLSCTTCNAWPHILQLTIHGLTCTAYHARSHMYNLPYMVSHAQPAMHGLPCTDHHAWPTMYSLACITKCTSCTRIIVLTQAKDKGIYSV